MCVLNKPISSSICKLPIRSEIYNCTFKTQSFHFKLFLFFFPFLSACDCNPAGSVSLQCDRNTGKCQCKQGMIGDKCDQCAPDTSGKMPQCEVCGECYYQWKVTLESLSRNISVEVPRAYNLSLTPQPGTFYTLSCNFVTQGQSPRRFSLTWRYYEIKKSVRLFEFH